MGMRCHWEVSFFFLDCTVWIVGWMSLGKPDFSISKVRSDVSCYITTYVVVITLITESEGRSFSSWPLSQSSGITFLLVSETETSIFTQVNWFQFHDREVRPHSHLQKQWASEGSNSTSWRALSPLKLWLFLLKVPFICDQVWSHSHS